MAKSSDATDSDQQPQAGAVTKQAPTLNQPSGGDSPETYSSTGGSLVRAPWGRAFRSRNDDLPLVDYGGVRVTKEQGEALVKEARSIGMVLTLSEYQSTDDN